MKYRNYLAIALSISMIAVGCTGCGNTTKSVKVDISTAGEVAGSVQEDSDNSDSDTEAEVEEGTYTIKVTKVKKESITGIVGEMGGTTEGTGEMPSMEEGQMPSGEGGIGGGFPGEMGSQFTETDEKITVNVTDDTEFVDETGEGVESIDDLKTGMILEVEVDSEGNVATVTVVSTGSTSQQGNMNMDMKDKNTQNSTEAAKSEEDSDL